MLHENSLQKNFLHGPYSPQAEILIFFAERILITILPKGLVDIAGYDNINCNHSSYGSVHKALVLLHLMLLLHVVSDLEVGKEGESEHGNCMEEKLEEYSRGLVWVFWWELR